MGECKCAYFWRSILVEFAGSCLFLYALCSFTVTFNPAIPSNELKLAMGIGFAFAVLVQVFRPSSGAHFNPAVSFAMMLTRKISILKGIFYMCAQFAGAIAGAGLCFTLTPTDHRGWLGVVRINPTMTVFQGFVVEVVLSFMVVLVVFASSDKKRNEQGFGPALATGLAYAVSHFSGMSYTGSSVNPARAFATAMTIDEWPTHHWIYWLAPIVGGAFAGVFYVFVVEPQPGNDSSGVGNYAMENIGFNGNGTSQAYQGKTPMP